MIRDDSPTNRPYASRERPYQVRTVAVVLVVLLAGLAAGTAPTIAADAPRQEATAIDSCTTITEPGQYRLTQDVRAETETVCIEIRASDVTLDGDGHAVRGQFDASRILAAATNATTPGPETEDATRTATPEVTTPDATTPGTTTQENATLDGDGGPAPLNATTPMGVYVNGNGTAVRENVEVRNLRASDWVFGVAYDNASGGLVENVTTSTNYAGVVALNATDTEVTGIRSTDDLVGVHFNQVSNSVLSSAAIRGGVSAITIHGSADNDLSNLTISGQEHLGVGLIGSDGHNLSDSSITDVRGTLSFGPMNATAIGLDSSSGFSVRDTVATNNENWTLLAENGSVRVEAENLTVDGLSASFSGRDFGVDTATADPRGLSSEGTATGLTVVKISESAAVSMEIDWAGGTANETTTAAG